MLALRKVVCLRSSFDVVCRVEIDTEAYLEKNPTMRLPGLGLDPKKDAEILLKQQKQRHNLEITLWLLDHSYTIQGTVPVP